MHTQTVYMSLDEKPYSERQTTWSIISGRFCVGLPVANDTLTTLTFYQSGWSSSFFFFMLESLTHNMYNRLNGFLLREESFEKSNEKNMSSHHMATHWIFKNNYMEMRVTFLENLYIDFTRKKSSKLVLKCVFYRFLYFRRIKNGRDKNGMLFWRRFTSRLQQMDCKLIILLS